MFSKKQIATLSALSLAALLTYAPSANAACACLCMDAPDGSGPAPSWECDATDFFQQPEPASCQEMVCPTAEPPADTTAGGDTGTGGTDTGTGGTDTGTGGADSGSDSGSDGGSDQVADNDTVEPPGHGMSCRYRKIYRPDLGGYKRHKVCRLTAERRAELRERLRERAAAWRERNPDYADRMARLREKHRARHDRKRRHRDHSDD